MRSGRASFVAAQTSSGSLDEQWAAAGDLDTRSDIHDVVVHFYREVVFDDLLAPVFGEVAEVDWTEHIPKLIDYWCQVLLGEPGYVGYILGPHRSVHEKSPITAELFDRWYLLWSESVDTRWCGPLADKAKDHAERIAGVLSRKLINAILQVDG